MNNEEFSEYSLWLKLANDPSQSEKARRHYRSQMEGYMHRKMRQAFQLAAQQTHPSPTTTKREG
jgi:hypothetical protein